MIDERNESLVFTSDDGRDVAVPAGYLHAGHLAHAYATTIHKAQGLTADTALVLADDALFQEAAYTALSRGRTRNQLYIVGPDIELRDEAHAPEHHRDNREPLQRCSRASQGQRPKNSRSSDGQPDQSRPGDPSRPTPESTWAGEDRDANRSQLSERSLPILALSARPFPLLWLSGQIVPIPHASTSLSPVADQRRIGVLRRHGRARNLESRNRG